MVEVATVLNDRVTHLTINLADLLSVKLISQIASGQLEAQSEESSWRKCSSVSLLPHKHIR